MHMDLVNEENISEIMNIIHLEGGLCNHPEPYDLTSETD